MSKSKIIENELSMLESVNLADCPFCGGKPTCNFDKNEGFYQIVCDNICAVTVFCEAETREDVLRAWNTRAG